MPTTVLERPVEQQAPPSGDSGRRDHAPTPAGAGRPPRRHGGDGGGGGRGRRGRSEAWSILAAALITAAIGSLFTFLGILTQIWANMIGSQLPGA